MGYAVDGTEESLEPALHDVMFDVAGGSSGKPGDIQFLNEDATISFMLTAINFATLAQAIANRRAGARQGTMPASGILLGASGFLKAVSIASPLGGKPVTYPSCVLVSPTRLPRATINTIIACTFRAIAYSGGQDSLAGSVLYTGGMG